jgi:hypothetical protein
MRKELRELDRLDAPDLRGRIGLPTRFTGVPDSDPGGGRRHAVAGALAVVVVLGVGALALWGLGPLGGTRSPPPTATASPASMPSDEHSGNSHELTSSGLVGPSHEFRCTATFPSQEVLPGYRTGVTVTVRNLSGSGTKVATGPSGRNADLVISRNGTVVVRTIDASNGIIGGYAFPSPLPPGGTAKLFAWDTAVLWPGPLHVVPRCMGTALPAVTLNVTNPGRTPDDDVSVQKAVAAAGAPFADCSPRRNMQWVTGTIHRGSSGSDLSFSARCGGVVLENPGFDIVVLGIVSPPDAPSVNLRQLVDKIEAVPSLGLPVHEAVAISWWVYVVTRDGIHRVTQRSASQNCEGTGGSYGSGIKSCRFPT